MDHFRSTAMSLSAAAMAAATLAGCAPVLHETDFVPARAARSADTGVTRTDSTYANAVAAIDRRDYARALELLQIARQQNAGDVRVLNAMGVIYDKLGRFDLSGRYYAEAAKVDPNSPIVQANLAYSRRLQDGSSGVQLAMAPILKVSPPAQGPSPGSTPTPVSAAEPDRLPALAAAPLARRAEATTPSGSPGQVELVTLIKARAAEGLAQLTALRLDAPTWKPPTPVVPQKVAAAPTPVALRLAAPASPHGATERQTLRIVNATGHLYRAEPVRAGLAALGWSAPRWAIAEARPQTRTVIFYPPSRAASAKALARTLPGPARLAACASECAGLRLVLGADAKSWKPMPRPVTRTRSRIA